MAPGRYDRAADRQADRAHAHQAPDDVRAARQGQAAPDGRVHRHHRRRAGRGRCAARGRRGAARHRGGLHGRAAARHGGPAGRRDDPPAGRRRPPALSVAGACRALPARLEDAVVAAGAGRHRGVGLARPAGRCAVDHAIDTGTIRAADGEPRTGRRRGFPQRLLSGPGSGGAQPVSRHAQAAYAAGACQCAHLGRRRSLQRVRPEPAVRHGGQRRDGTGRRHRPAGRTQAGCARLGHPSGHRRRAGADAAAPAVHDSRRGKRLTAPHRGPPMADHLFVYFRIAERDAATALPCWQRWLDTVEEATGVSGTLMRRPDVRDGLATWMEWYHDIPPAFAATLAGLWETGGPREFVAGERHAEHFAELDGN
ncbi:conserved hypothetical protein [Ralstonia solanacearum Po82]|uniref:DUF4936 domain-containing protein n=3 Tax=Ralstonia solanacearum TaxID=305 RepID=F6G0Y3_RALS8|nr:conserved hypothetical protein [Ralstonia solanacearum Po82]